MLNRVLSILDKHIYILNFKKKILGPIYHTQCLIRDFITFFTLWESLLNYLLLMCQSELLSFLYMISILVFRKTFCNKTG